MGRVLSTLFAIPEISLLLSLSRIMISACMGSSDGPPTSGENRAKTCTGEEDHGGDKELSSSADTAACTRFFVISAAVFRCCKQSSQ